MNARSVGYILANLLIAALPLAAHHSFSAEYDTNQPVKVTGVVTKVEWLNPHIWFYVDVKGDDGKVANWAFSGGAPGQLMRRGISKSVIQPGMTSWSKVIAPRTARTTPMARKSLSPTAARCSLPAGKTSARREGFQERREKVSRLRGSVMKIFEPVCASLLAAAVFAGLVFTTARVQAQASKAIPRTSDGKPDFSGMYEWPKSSAGRTLQMLRHRFRPQQDSPRSSPAANPSLKRRPEIRAMTSRATSACRPVFPPECCRPTRFNSCRTRTPRDRP